MFTFIAWIGIALGFGVVAGIVFLFFRQRIARKATLAPEAGLYVSDSPTVKMKMPDDFQIEMEVEGNDSNAKEPPKKSLSDRLKAPSGLQGNLTQVPVHDFLQFLAQGKRTGILEVVSGRRHGYIKMLSGQIEHAVFRGRSGLPALFGLLPLKEGDFEFMEGADAKLPVHAEAGEPHPTFEVLDVLFRWDAQMKKPGTLRAAEGEI